MGLRSRAKQDIPAGTIWLYYGTAAPPGWLFCDGGSTTGYSALAAVAGANTPDMRGRLPIGTTATGEVKILGTAYGAETVQIPDANSLPAHSHGGGAHTHSVASHTHTVGLHGHSGAGHGHTASHGHAGHAHGGIVHVGTGGSHDHWGQWGQTAGNPGGYFTGAYADTANAWSGGQWGNTAGPGMYAEQPGTSGPNSVASNTLSGTVISSEGSGQGFAVMPPGLALHFIIKT